jgi:hypothetical protein
MLVTRQSGTRQSGDRNYSRKRKSKTGLMDGLKKTFGKASQAISEKVSNNADRTEMDPQFREMERLTDATSKTIQELVHLSREYLQPNSRKGSHEK